VVDGGLTPLRILRLLFLMFLVGGPMIAMVLSLLCVTWMFTFIEFNPNKKNPINFPARVFTLPVSTSFLFWFLYLGGMAAISMLYASWVYLVPLPKLEEFGVYQECFGWIDPAGAGASYYVGPGRLADCPASDLERHPHRLPLRPGLEPVL